MSDTTNNSSHHPRNIPNDISSLSQFSILLSWALDILGYNQDMVRHRVDYWKFHDRWSNVHFVDEIIHAGSQTEGVVAPFGSDLDTMAVDKTVICADNFLSVIDHKSLTLFQTDSRDTEPGYTQLKLIKNENLNSIIIEASLFQSDNGDTYISSDTFSNIYLSAARIQYGISTLSKAGPAIPVINYKVPGFVNDLVYCFKCHCPALLGSWLKRPRRYNWPSANILYDISQMEAHVVPVGCKGSDAYYQEWRICFTKAEIHLVHNFNDTQIKMYIILKMVAKTILKIKCPEITSYIIKNIVLWMCESLPGELFTEHQLVYIITQALELLRLCVKQNCLPSYMIPDRNLFHGRIELRQKEALINSLSSMEEDIHNRLFRRLDKICDAMSVLYQEPERTWLYGIKRNAVEVLISLSFSRRILIVSDSIKSHEETIQILDQDEIYMNAKMTLMNLVVPEWELIWNYGDVYCDRIEKYLK